MVGDAKLHQFGGQMLSDLGGAASVASARMGDAFRRLKNTACARPDDSGRACRSSSNATMRDTLGGTSRISIVRPEKEGNL
jgi:hypothetical protein